jgi:hypothetical protein
MTKQESMGVRDILMYGAMQADRQQTLRSGVIPKSFAIAFCGSRVDFPKLLSPNNTTSTSSGLHIVPEDERSACHHGRK